MLEIEPLYVPLVLLSAAGMNTFAGSGAEGAVCVAVGMAPGTASGCSCLCDRRRWRGGGRSRVFRFAAYGHFGRDDIEFPWEQTDKAEALKNAAGLQCCTIKGQSCDYPFIVVVRCRA